ncbi:hypothetical protein WA026_008234 [Henosepilachna vigintioctopunctata]|uniref:Uncharacterized protein n=1 Tax=Henosepilachna vigintioctopunctata TaxID=420089 RepID=A0AAW1TU36_9CUCU
MSGLARAILMPVYAGVVGGLFFVFGILRNDHVGTNSMEIVENGMKRIIFNVSFSERESETLMTSHQRALISVAAAKISRCLQEDTVYRENDILPPSGNKGNRPGRLHFLEKPPASSKQTIPHHVTRENHKTQQYVPKLQKDGIERETNQLRKVIFGYSFSNAERCSKMSR